MKTSFLSKLALLFVFSVIIQSCTADDLPADTIANQTKPTIKPIDVSADATLDDPGIDPNVGKTK